MISAGHSELGEGGEERLRLCPHVIFAIHLVRTDDLQEGFGRNWSESEQESFQGL